MKLADLIIKLAKKAGYDVAGEEFKKITFPDLDIPDEVAGAIDQKLMNEAAAASNSTVRNKIKAEALNGIDALVQTIIEEDQLQGTDDIRNAQSSYERVKKLYTHIKDVYNQKVKDAVKPGKSDADREKLEGQIAELNNQLKVLKQTLADKEKQFNDTRENDLTTFDIHKILLGKDYALPKEMDSDLKLQTAYSAINKQLQAKGLKVIRKEGQLSIVKTDGTPAYNESNEAIELNSFFDGALAQNKLLKVNDPARDNGGGGNQHVHIPVGGQPKATQSFNDGLGQLEQMISEASKS